MADSPTTRSLKSARKAGYHAAVVEKWNAHAKIRQDLFGIIDIVAVSPDGAGVFGIQATSYTNISGRVQKSLDNDVLLDWLKAGNRYEVWGWKKKKNGRYECHRRSFTAEGNNIIVDKVDLEKEAV